MIMTQDAASVGGNSPETKKTILNKLKNGCFDCRDCTIGQNKIESFRPQVFARGSVNAKIVLVGQNPGRTEVEQSKPFIGSSGKFLDKMMETVGLDKKNLYVTNSVKCYTPENRAPTEVEIGNCKKFLVAELNLLRPKLIVTLGNSAMKSILGYTGITNNRGQLKRSNEFSCDVFPLLHPASTLHNKNKYAPMMEEDLEKLKSIIQTYL